MASVAEVMALYERMSPEERVEFRERLDALEPPTKLTPAWRAELVRRSEELKSGAVKGIPLSDFLAELDADIERLEGKEAHAPRLNCTPGLGSTINSRSRG